MRLSDEQRKERGGPRRTLRLSAAWKPNRSALGDEATNEQRQVSRLLELAAEEVAKKQRVAGK